MRLISLLILGSFILFSTAFAAPKKSAASTETVVFNIRNGRSNQGKEEYKLSTNNAKHVLTSTVQLQKLGEKIVSTEEEILAANWSPLHYSLKTSIGSEQRSSEASVTAGGVRMHTEFQGKTKDKSIGLNSPALVMDNVVPSHFQVLLYQYGALHAQNPVQFQLLVPQIPTQFSGTLSTAGSDTGTLRDRRVQLRKYVLQTRGLKLEIWADTHGQLMRVYLPEQDTEFVRVGFSPGNQATSIPSRQNRSGGSVVASAQR